MNIKHNAYLHDGGRKENYGNGDILISHSSIKPHAVFAAIVIQCHERSEKLMKESRTETKIKLKLKLKTKI